jgi:hypothetical protein
MMMPLSNRWIRSILLAIAIAPFTGCAMFDAEKWNPNRLRDDRAVDIDRRLSEDRPIVQNPF